MGFFANLVGKKLKSTALAQQHFDRGAHFAMQQEWDAAIEALNEAVRLDPKHAKAHMALCMAYGGKMDVEAARRHLNILKQLDPGLASQVANTPAGMLIETASGVIMMSDGPARSVAGPPNPASERTKHLMEAIEWGQVKAVRVMIEEGVDVNGKADGGYTALAAASSGEVEIVQLLLAAGALVNDRSSGEITPLIEAALHGRLEIVQALLDHGAQINAPDSLGETPLHRAAYAGKEQVAQLLIERGANLNLLTKRGLTAARLAEEQGRKAVAKLIRHAGGR